MSRFAIVAVGFVATACIRAPSDKPRAADAYDVVTAGAMTAGELAKGHPDKSVYGWKVQLGGGRLTYYACSAIDACSQRSMEVPAESLAAMKVVGRARPTLEDGTLGEEIDVVQLTLTKDVQTTRGGASSDARGLVVR